MMGYGKLCAAGILAVAAIGCGDHRGPSGPERLTADEAKEALFDRGIHISATTFRQAVARNDLEALELFFAAGQDVNARDKRGATALAYANTVDIARLLLERGADVNARDDSGHTPLWGAVGRNDADLARLLLEHGADPNVPVRKNIYSLMRAAGRGNAELVTVLLDHEAYTDVRDEQNRTPGMYATFAGHEEILELLIDRANPGALQAEAEPVDFSGFGYVDREAFERTWQIDLSLKDEPARKAVERFCEALNLEIRGPQPLKDRLNNRITLQLEGVSRLEAVERIMEQLGMRSKYEEADERGQPSGLWLEDGERRWPAAFTGPFVVALPSYAWAEPALEVSVYGFGLDGAWVAKSEEDLLYVAEVGDSEASNRITKREKAVTKDPIGKDPRAIVGETTLGLDEALKVSPATVTIRGRIAAALLTKTEEVRLEPVDVGATARVAGMQFAVTGLPEKTPGSIPTLDFAVAGAGEDFGPNRYEVRAYNEEGQRLPDSGRRYAAAMGEDPFVSLNIREAPAYAVIEVVTDIGKVTYPFEIEDVVLAAP